MYTIIIVQTLHVFVATNNKILANQSFVMHSFIMDEVTQYAIPYGIEMYVWYLITEPHQIYT